MRFLLLAAALLVTAAPALAQNVAGDPTYGTVSLDEGFMPDPHDIDLVAGGTVDVDEGSCTYGSVASDPDVDLRYEGGSTLYIYAVSSEDTTILVNTANGSWVCDDDSFGDGDPLVVIPNAGGGLYNIWVGTYSGGTAEATLFISEIDPR